MPASKAQQTAVAERRAKAIQMRLAGVDWDVITDRLGYRDRNHACKDVRRALAAHRKQEAADADEMRQVVGMRYERLIAALWPKALKGDTKAAETAGRMNERLGRLYGVEAPRRVNVEAQQLGDEIMALLAEMGADDGDG